MLAALACAVAGALVACEPAEFGWALLEARGPLARVGHGCSPVPGVQGAVAVALRGECAFADKARALQASGAAAVLVQNADGAEPFRMGGDAPDVRIPVALVAADALADRPDGADVTLSAERSAARPPGEFGAALAEDAVLEAQRLAAQRDYGGAHAAYERAVELLPGPPPAEWDLLRRWARLDVADWRPLPPLQLGDAVPDDVLCRRAMPALQLPVERVRQACSPPPPAPAPAPPRPADSTTVAVASHCLGEHAVGRLVRPLLAPFVCFVPERDLAVARAACAEALPLTPAAIRARRVAVLLDLDAWTRAEMPPLLAQRAAPLQLHYIGQPLALGRSALHDAMVTDARIAPPELQPRSGSPLYLRASYFAPRALLDSSPAASLAFGVLNQAKKLSPLEMDAWTQLLQRRPAATLVFTAVDDATARARLQAEAAARGLSPARLRFVDRVESYDAHLNRLRELTAVLDTRAYSAGSVAVDAAMAGTPLLAWLGGTVASRQAAAISGLFAHSAKEYVSVAMELPRRAWVEPRALGDAAADGGQALLRAAAVAMEQLRATGRVRGAMVGS